MYYESITKKDEELKQNEKLKRNNTFQKYKSLEEENKELLNLGKSSRARKDDDFHNSF